MVKKISRYVWDKGDVVVGLHGAEARQSPLAKWNPKKGSRCLYCKHNNKEKIGTCKAFPDGIPHEILSSEFNHIEFHPRDHGIKFELDKEMVERFGL